MNKAKQEVVTFWNLLGMDMERAVFSIGFLLAVLITFVAIYFSASADIHPQSTIVYIYNFAIKYNNSCSMIILAASLAYTASFCVDRNSGILRFIIARSDEQKYALSKCVSCSLAGGLSVLLGAVIFLVFLHLYGLGLLPPRDELLVEYSRQSFGSLLLGPAPWLYFVCMFAVLFIQSAFWSCLGLCVSGYLPNQYIAYSAPFIACFAFIQIANMFSLPVWLNPVQLGIAYKDMGGPVATLVITFCVFLTLITLCSVLFIRQVKRRMSND